MRKIKIGRSDFINIAKSKFKCAKERIEELDHSKWIEFIESHKDYFIWYEDTEDGIYRKNNMDKVPDWARLGVKRQLNRTDVNAEYNNKKGYYEVRVCFGVDGIIYITFQKKITYKHLEMFLDMANHLDALLLKNGNEIIDTKFIEELKNDSKIRKKKIKP